jgi:hypothetical protein
VRLPLAVGLESRAGALTKDSKVLNGLIEKKSETVWRLRKRPGVEDYGLVRAGQAQLLTYWRDTVITVIDDYIGGGSASEVATWNSSDKGAGITLSNGNLTVACANGSGDGVRATTSQTTGKWYWEVTVGAAKHSSIGVANASADIEGGTNFIGFDNHGLGVNFNGTIIKNNSVLDNLGAFITGDIISVALNMDAGTVAFRLNNGSPVTISGANVPTGALFAAVSGTNNTAADSTTNFGAAPFTYSIPTGFLAYGDGTSQALSVSTADLPFSSQDNGENASTPRLMIKSREKAWTMDQYFIVSAITDVDYPGTYAVTLTGLTRSGTTATATTATDANFQVGQSITIAGASQSDYNGAKTVTSVTPAAGTLGVAVDIVSITRSSTTATATTATPHGLSNGQSVLIEGAAQAEYNGTKTITWLSATTFSYTVTVTGVTSPATGAVLALVTGSVSGDALITVSGGTATLTTTFPHGLATGATVSVRYYAAGVYQEDSGAITVGSTTTFTVSVGTSDVTDVLGSYVYTTALTISSVTSSDGVTATVTTTGSHFLTTGSVHYAEIFAATPAYYNVSGNIISTGAATFTYTMGQFATVPATSPVTPATGVITATPVYVSATGASFTFEVANSPTTPATGTITATGGKNTVPGIVYFDGYFLVMDVNGVVYNSKEDDPRTWEPLEFLIAQTETGAGKAIARTVNYVVCFKEWSTEFLWNAGNEPPGSPFSPVPNSANLIGCAEGLSVAEVAGNLVWIGQGKKVKGRGVYMMSGTQPQKISTPDIDRVIALDSLAEVYAYGVELDGHPCYVLTLGTTDITLVYDISSGEWTQWSSYTVGSSKSVTSITLSGTTATVTFAVPHTLSDGDPVLIAGANQAAYNGIQQAAYVSTTVITFETTAGTTTPATGTITGSPYTESGFKFVKYANCGGLNLVLHESDGHLYKILSSLYRDAGLPINVFARSRREDGGTLARKKLPRISLIADSASDTAMVRWSDDDCSTFAAYRRITLSDTEPMTRQCGAFHRRTFEYRHIGNTAPVVEALEMEISR